MEKKKIIWIELLRIAACLGVIGIYVAAQHFRDLPLDSNAWKIHNFYCGINRFAVACFFMISGLLHLDKKRTWTLKKLWGKSILHLAAAYAFWQIFYGYYQIRISNGPATGTAAFFYKMLKHTSKSFFHLWYLPALAGFFIITPLVWEFVNCPRGKKWEEYFLLLYLVMQVIPYTLSYLPIPSTVEKLLHTVEPPMLASYLGYYIMGHYLYQYGVPKKIERGIYLLGVLFIGAGIYLCQQTSATRGEPVQSFYENHTLAVFFWSTAVFLFFRNYLSRIAWRPWMEKAICRIGGCTFGIYLVHAFYRSVLHRAGIDSMMMKNTAVAIPLVILLIFFLSLGTVLFLKVIPGVKKWIV